MATWVFLGECWSFRSKRKIQRAIAAGWLHRQSRGPEIRVYGNPYSTRLSATFRATINGLNGDTTLNLLNAQLNYTPIEASGEIKADATRPGKTTSLHLSVEDGRIEDFLSLFASNAKPALIGQISMRANVMIPPGSPGFLEKLKLSGSFDISASRFTNEQTQTEINHLSKSAEGMSKDEEKADAATILSRMRGEVMADHGTATLSHAALSAPGADAAISETYSLVDKRLNLHGLLKTTGKIADTASGLKAIVLKVATPFWKKNALTLIPFTVSGTSQQPAFALALVRK